MKIIHLTNDPYAPFDRLVKAIRNVRVRAKNFLPEGYEVQEYPGEHFFLYGWDLICEAYCDENEARVEYDEEAIRYFMYLSRDLEMQFVMNALTEVTA